MKSLRRCFALPRRVEPDYGGVDWPLPLSAPLADIKYIIPCDLTLLSDDTTTDEHQKVSRLNYHGNTRMMSKQTRLNFGQGSSAPSKRRRLNTSESSAVDHDDDENEKTSKSSSKAKITDQDSSIESESTEEPKGKNAVTTSQQQQPSTSPSPNHLTLTHHPADLFTAPPHTLLCHATNAQGTWGAGIAAAFKKHYPAAFKIYAAHCAKWPTSSLLGTTFLIPPQEKSFSKAEREAQHWIGCLFTSEKKGKGKGSKESILEATGDAMHDLVRRVKDVNDEAAAASAGGSRSGGPNRTAIASVRMCKINSGLFGVPWGATAAVVEGIEVEDGDLKEIEVFSMD
jgi:ADP-ribose 1''-phosphate phosphatase